MKLVAKDDRYRALKIYDNLIVNIYLYVNKALNSYSCSVIDILTGIGNLIKSHTKHEIVICGDFNFDFTTIFYLKNLWEICKLKCREILIDSTYSMMFTYCYASLNSHSFIDHFLVDSASYCDVVNWSIDDCDTNLYDRCALLLSIKMSDPHSIKRTLPIYLCILINWYSKYCELW